jgi:tRNA/tmRNA/rRNA uracil-C5-methylase (TrmA/RlmC/RlmD family)
MQPIHIRTGRQNLMAGGYKLKSIQIFDQFIYTAHIELVGVFKR